MDDHKEIYENPQEALGATDAFYGDEGFSYTQDVVAQWLDVYLLKKPEKGRALDLCCGDGVWSLGLKTVSPGLALYGIDVSTGGIEKARSLVSDYADQFVVGDAEAGLPWPDAHFDLIFARGPGLFNQHSMDRPATIAVIEDWHRHLRKPGRMVSTFYSSPELFGTYTNPLKVSLPYNRSPRLTDAVDFTGGKYHHDIRQFLTPFWKAANVKILDYRFVRNNHILTTTVQ